MKMVFRVTVWTVLTLAVLTLWQGLHLGKVRAQAPAAAQEQKADARKIYTTKTSFKLPIKIEERTRANLANVCLYVKPGQGDWVLKETVPPSQDSFTYQVAQDGEYWFSVVTIDKAGKQTPADVSRESPGLMVVVDTQRPEVEVHRAVENAEVCLRCTVKDANPDLQTLKLSYRAADGTWKDLDPLPGARGTFRVPPGVEALTGLVRVSVSDLCKNPCTREIQMSEPVTTGGPALPAAGPSLAHQGGPELMLQDQANPLPPGPPRGINQSVAAAPVLGNAPKGGETTSARPAYTDSAFTPVSHNVSAMAQAAPPPAAGNRQLLNTAHVSIDYRLDHVGPSGVSKVEVWLTSDQGRNWQRVCDDVDLRSPAEVDLPGEGLFGLRLVVTNGNGFGGTPPLRGDAPHYWVEVDTTGPHAVLRDIDPVASGGNLEIRWTASDKNLGTEPVSLYYATRREGPWVPVVRNLKNDGMYRWAFPRDAGSQFFVRMEVVDQAGNVTKCEPASPVVLDMTEPHALVVGVTGSGVRTAPHGN